MSISALHSKSRKVFVPTVDDNPGDEGTLGSVMQVRTIVLEGIVLGAILAWATFVQATAKKLVAADKDSVADEFVAAAAVTALAVVVGWWMLKSRKKGDTSPPPS